MDLDKFYTPPVVASEVAAAVRFDDVRSIVDSNCGAGNLLDAAVSHFPKAAVLGIDADSPTIRKLAGRRPSWKLVAGNSLTQRAWAVYPEFEPDIAILNPPFSLPTFKGIETTFAGKELRVSTAMAHVLATLSHSQPKAIAAILPESWAYSELDSPARRELTKSFSIEVVKTLSRSTFRGAHANALLVRMTRRARDLTKIKDTSAVALGSDVRIVRGGLPVFEATSSRVGSQYVHTTDFESIVAGDTGRLTRVKNIGRGIAIGEVILLPRVGVPRQHLVAPIYLKEATQLSDCVFAICFGSRVKCHAGADLIHAKWQDLVGIYRGTGARYVTTARLTNWFAKVWANPFE
jgi:hypothetical protein